MSIEQEFNRIAKEYDQNRRRFLPCFDDFYMGATKWIAYHIAEPKKVLDLGAGTGLLSYFWLQQYPNAEFLLVDIADEMLEVARKRFSGQSNISYQVLDYTKTLPNENFDVVASALSIHHLQDEDKKKLFGRIYDLLPEGGLFVNYDQFCAGQKELDKWFDRYWEDQILHSGLTDKDIALWRQRKKLDIECSVEWETEMLRLCGFKMVKCIYSYQKYSVIIAIK